MVQPKECSLNMLKLCKDVWTNEWKFAPIKNTVKLGLFSHSDGKSHWTLVSWNLSAHLG